MTTPMNRTRNHSMGRRLAIVMVKSGGIPLAIMAARVAGAALPFVPAAILGGGLCGAAAYSFFKSLWNLTDHS